MALFERPNHRLINAQHNCDSLLSESASAFFDGNSLAALRQTIGELQPNTNLHFFTKGSWSTHNLVEYLARKIGPSKMYFSTYSMTEETLRNIHLLMDKGLITGVQALLDYRIEKRKAESFQFAMGMLSNHGVAKCHAKVTVLINNNWAVSVTGSSNMTKNRKIEAGVICTERKVAKFYRDWILKEINDG